MNYDDEFNNGNGFSTHEEEDYQDYEEDFIAEDTSNHQQRRRKKQKKKRKNDTPFSWTSSPRYVVISLLASLPELVSEAVYRFLLTVALLGGWGIFFVTSTTSFSTASILFSSIRNGELMDLQFSMLMFQVNGVEALSFIFGVALEYGSLGIDFFVSHKERQYLRVTKSQTLEPRNKRKLQWKINGEIFQSKIVLLFIFSGYCILVFTVLCFFLSSDMNVTTLGDSFVGGHIEVPPILHLPTDRWELIATTLMSFGLGASSMMAIPQLVVGVTVMFIDSVLKRVL